MISRLRTLLSGGRPDIYAVLDIGTVEAKALLVVVEGDQASIVGAGRQAHQPGAVVNGILADAAIAARSCEAALARAEAQTETVAGETLVADRAIVGLCGPMLTGICLTLTTHRPRAHERMSEGELRSIIQRAERLVVQQAHTQIAAQTGGSAAEVGLVSADLIHVLVDGYPITHSVAVTGAQVDVRLSNIFASAASLADVNAVVTALDLEPVAVLSGCCALARLPAVGGRGDALVLDIGGECTDLALVRPGGIASLQTLPMGGASFTRRIGRALGIAGPAAEEIKKAYAGGRLDQARAAQLWAAMADDVHTWIDGIQALLEETAKREDLPAHIVVGGGGAALPDMERAIRLHPWTRLLSFERSPQVTLATSRWPVGLTDRTQQAGGHDFAVPAALAAWAVQLARPTSVSTPQRILQQVVHGMGLS